MKTEQTQLDWFTVDARYLIRVSLVISELRCLTLTTGSGDWEPHAIRGKDNPQLELSYTTANGATNTLNTSQIGEIGMSASHRFGDRYRLQVEDPGAWLEVKVKGWELDDWGDDYMGESVVRFERRELLELIGYSTTRGMPYLTQHDGEWGVILRISVEKSN